jgi:uncharacterized protein (TIGR00725 family)
MASTQVSVIGSGVEHEQRAEEVGTTIGIVPGETRAGANAWTDHVVVTGIGHGRNLAVVASGDAVIAVGGRYGTLAEIGFALTLGRTVVVLEPGWEVDGTLRAATPEQAVELALQPTA